MNSLERKALNLLKSIGILPSKKEVTLLQNELKRLVFQAINQERQRCYEYAMFCKTEFEKKPTLPQSISLASEVIADGILQGSTPRRNLVEKNIKLS